ncbi:probable LRR receptor-like serine/threonine-protein kinase At3g47570 isoform X1 [Mercurialis annua]|uniref:probable LRR receptor-like serine/threonine-protein kinase At3g47570 isoform X1 n=1 Tax=Mercurialis annua TaxID=3986 RepID=UPI0024AE7D37|nr:probable LRR receptor-like serine/threonine-protein kinase At3g47570 isoform X1 [Mercurialis annua]
MGIFRRSLIVITIIHLFLIFTLIHAATNGTDGLALLEFKAKITDDPLGVMTSWNSSHHFCEWYGVVCGSRHHQRVTVLYLYSLQLSGSISPHIGNLSFLRELHLYNNSFRYEIPPQIGHLRRLQVLYLLNNSLGGKIPSNLSSCSNLNILDLYGNQLIGEIPIELTLLTRLKELYLGKNNITGTIPPSIANLTSLEFLYLTRNNLHGVIPEFIGQLKNLRVLALGFNQLSGTLHSSIFNLSLIQVIDVGGNSLQGTLPVSLGVSFPYLQFFSIDENQFSGSIPSSISNASNMEIFEVGDNKLTGVVPSFGKLNKLLELFLFGNHFGNGKDDDLKFLHGLTNATRLRKLDLGVNNFGGMLPKQITNFSRELESIYINNNQIHGNIPTGIDSLISLNIFVASNNNLSGTIPSGIGKLKNLAILSLSSNDLTGNIPSSLGNLTNLIQIYLYDNQLHGNIPPNLGNCKQLLALSLFRNNLTGLIPPQIFEISSLSMGIDLSTNRLHGSLPNQVGNLKQLGILYLDNNMLSGHVPSDLGGCVSLEALSISHNFFQGSIPSSLSALRGLQFLNLSYNNVSGQIPSFLVNFSLLALDISHNDFEGMVPIEGIFNNASATSIVGNKRLCGGISEFRLPSCKSDQKPKRKRRRTVIITVSAFTGILASILGCLFLWFPRKRRKDSSSSDSENVNLLRLSYQNLLKATNEFSLDNLIGSGGFGSVYKGILEQDGLVIAVKVLNLMRRGASKSFLAECEVLKNVRHRNLVKVITACSSVDYAGNDFKALVYEFMDNGSLDDWLHPTHHPRNLTIVQRLNIAIDVSSALEYLHCHAGILPIVHCDIKPSNVLLDKEMTAHVGDFGLVKFFHEEIIHPTPNQSTSLADVGTIGYCPPEYGMGNVASASGDIFSFGILLLEMFTGKRPTDDTFKEGLSLHEFVKSSLPEQVTDIADPTFLQMEEEPLSHFHYSRNIMRKNRLIECLISVLDIGILCSSESPQERLNIGDVVTQLSSIKNKLPVTIG